MESQTGVLQQRVQILPVKRWHGQTQERVRGEQDEGKESHGNRRLNRQHTRPQGGRQVGSEPRGHRAEQGDDQHPQQHRPFVVPPRAADFIQHRLGRMRVQHHQPERKVRHDKGMCQRAKGQ